MNFLHATNNKNYSQQNQTTNIKDPNSKNISKSMCQKQPKSKIKIMQEATQCYSCPTVGEVEGDSTLT